MNTAVLIAGAGNGGDQEMNRVTFVGIGVAMIAGWILAVYYDPSLLVVEI